MWPWVKVDCTTIQTYRSVTRVASSREACYDVIVDGVLLLCRSTWRTLTAKTSTWCGPRWRFLVTNPEWRARVSPTTATVRCYAVPETLDNIPSFRMIEIVLCCFVVEQENSRCLLKRRSLSLLLTIVLSWFRMLPLTQVCTETSPWN